MSFHPVTINIIIRGFSDLKYQVLIGELEAEDIPFLNKSRMSAFEHNSQHLSYRSK